MLPKVLPPSSSLHFSYHPFNAFHQASLPSFSPTLHSRSSELEVLGPPYPSCLWDDGWIGIEGERVSGSNLGMVPLFHHTRPLPHSSIRFIHPSHLPTYSILCQIWPVMNISLPPLDPFFLLLSISFVNIYHSGICSCSIEIPREGRTSH